MTRSVSGFYRKYCLPLVGLARAATGVHAPLPRFLIIGVGRSGTSSLYQTLLQHPQIARPYVKELKFFNRHYPLGMRWYRSMLMRDHLRRGAPAITFEATANYFSQVACAARIARWLPDTKLVLLWRNPADRAISSYYFQTSGMMTRPSPIERFLNDEMDFLDGLLDRPWGSIYEQSQRKLGGIVCATGGLYAHALKHWLQFIPHERFLFLRSEDYFADQTGTANRVFRFVGAAPFEVTNGIHEHRGSYPPTDAALYARLTAFYRNANRDLTELAGDELRWD